jgi:hypothetical protein
MSQAAHLDLYGPRLPGFGVLHRLLRDETTVFHTQSASEQVQLVNIAIVVRQTAQ